GALPDHVRLRRRDEARRPCILLPGDQPAARRALRLRREGRARLRGSPVRRRGLRVSCAERSVNAVGRNAARLAIAGGALVALGAVSPWRWIVPAFVGPLGLFMALVGVALIMRACVVDTSTLRVADGAAFEPVSPAEAVAAADPAFREFCRRNGFELVGYRL